MSEQGMRQRVVRALKPLDAVSVENRVGPGTPDVNFIGGWLELKWARSWPVGEDSIVKFDHFNVYQRAWLMRRSARGGYAGVLVQVSHDWLLFDGMSGASYVGKVTKSMLIANARYVWLGGLRDKEFFQAVCQNLETTKLKSS